MKRDFICIKDWSVEEIEDILSLSEELKRNPQKFAQVLAGKTIALLFEKPSLRTHVSFMVGMYQLGGNAFYLGPEQVKLGVREPIKDIARTLSRYVEGIVLRTFSQENVLEMARYATVPVINGLSDLLHPCQALADIFTIKEKKGKLKGVNLGFIGDGNNVLHSLLYACAKLGINLFIATPKKYQPRREIFEEAKEFAQETKSEISLVKSPLEVAKTAEFLYTDVWVSMGQEREREKRLRDFKGFQINEELIEKAKNNPYILHCLPCHRGEEITEAVIESKYSLVFEQAENRLHVQKAILIRLLS
ncbi:MAG: ornithine carbamoyltransferase [Candidatus Omnitrophica bacterium]|nr:ornithine carbamoyltransferase [Candidatus Omnitrophota bacterium]MCM8793933.1 ornithine carbamoyltransferase [Candidatus Omnitrophota bacterium]